MDTTDSPTSALDLDFETRSRLEQHLDAVDEVLRRYQQPRSARAAIVDELENQVLESLAQRIGDRDATLDELTGLLAEMDPPEAYARNSIDLPAESISTGFSFPGEVVESKLNKATLLGLVWWMWLLIALITTLFLINIEVTAKADYRASPRDPLWTSISAIQTGWGIAIFIVVCIPGFIAPFASPILGWVGVSQIRYSRGRQHGLGLAFAQGALLPITGIIAFFGGLIVAPVGWGIHRMFEHHKMWGTRGPDLSEVQWIGASWIFGAIALATLISLIVIWIVVRRMWRKTSQPV
ncbi:MAG: hypothetical protein AAGG38_06580 [Planctomycetota bacterium]